MYRMTSQERDIQRGTLQLKGKVERSHRSDQEEPYQPLSYKDDVDLGAKLDEWEAFYNFNRPHGAFNEKNTLRGSQRKATIPKPKCLASSSNLHVR